MVDQPILPAPRLNRTMERGNWFLHYNEAFVGDVLIRHKEEDHLEVRIPIEAFKDLVAEASKWESRTSI